ncbi:SWIM zinc finger family protein [Haladaptatus sp. DYF46]|uniref:SWIM zinc finger family protein n=1 Tax=Haladaptatus sp. DYF46 TaxID=2886041 RepID=UPI001E4D6CE6|nr:SWIM zinc finger family protein [Haladaptatus sp. DYF46]
MACTCPHHVHRNAYCKHMDPVENATDDGTLDAFPSVDDEDNEDDTESTKGNCDGLNGFHCWPCVRMGRKKLPNEPLLQSCYPWHAK